jgi:hypothetical protein
MEHLIGDKARGPRGAFTTKQVKGETYLYFQASQPGGSTRQYYLGRKTPTLDRIVRGLEKRTVDAAADLARARRLVAQLRLGGANQTDSASARVIKGLAEAGVFDVGGVLVGTHAFVTLGNLLGVRWTSGSLRTQDVDIAGSREADIDVAVPDIEADVPTALESLKMGFLPVPQLDPKEPSTSFKVRGQALRVDLLCPLRDAVDNPVFLRRFKAAAQPLAFLDFVMEAPERAVVLDGDGSLVNVPTPARFGLHKLAVSQLRPATFQSKAAKDIQQAGEVLKQVLENRPGDLELAWDAVDRRGARLKKAIERGLAALGKVRSDLSLRLREDSAFKRLIQPRHVR